jgi:hypothetical protein
MTKSTLPLLALILSTALHAGEESSRDPFECHFEALSRQKLPDSIKLGMRRKPVSTPVKLLQPTGPVRFGTAMVVELNTGQKVTAVSNATTATPDMIWELLQRQYRGRMLRPLWCGEVEIRKQEGEGSPGRIVRATTLPVELDPLAKDPPTENSVEHLVAALTAVKPDLVDPTGVRTFPSVRPNHPQPKLVPFLTRQGAVTDVLLPMQRILHNALRTSNNSETTAPQFVDTFSANTQTFADYKVQFSSVLKGLENDGLIDATKRHQLETFFLDMISNDPKPNRYLGDAFHGELTTLLDKISYVVSNPHDHVEIIEPGTTIGGTGAATPAGQ